MPWPSSVSGTWNTATSSKSTAAPNTVPSIIAKAKTYVRYWQSGREQAETGIFPFVLWVAPDEARADLLIDALVSLAG